MKLALAIGVGCAMAAAGFSFALAASSNSAAVGCKPETGKRIVNGRDFRFTLLVGNAENMYMPHQVRANHLKHGEEMLRGSMTPVAMLTGGRIRHLEVQICVRTTRAVVTNANPKIVVDDTTRRKAVTLPISVMEGIGEGVADLHYGNNLAMPARGIDSSSPSLREGSGRSSTLSRLQRRGSGAPQLQPRCRECAEDLAGVVKQDARERSRYLATLRRVSGASWGSRSVRSERDRPSSAGE